jgi:integrase
MKRNRRAGVEDRWTKSDGQPSASYGKGSRWRARYVDERGREHARGFARKVDAQAWLDQQTAALVGGTHVAPRDAAVTVAQWCELWLRGYEVNRPNTVRNARFHVAVINEAFGDRALTSIRPSEVKSWTAVRRTNISVICLCAAQPVASGVGRCRLDGLLGRNPCSRRTSPPRGKAECYAATTEQIWALCDAMPGHLQAAVLLGAFAGSRIGEACGLRVSDVDFVRGVVHPVRQYGDQPLKTDGSAAPIPVPRELTLLLSAAVALHPSEWMVPRSIGGGERPCSPNTEEAVRTARAKVPGLPDQFCFHDLRHYLASLLIASGADIKTVQARMRHATAATTLDVYGHLWPDADESTRATVGAAIAARSETTADDLRTIRPQALGNRRSFLKERGRSRPMAVVFWFALRGFLSWLGASK